ncbi:MAG: SgcJ/EcaC family oxidoreductase [Gemmatimonadaceae bacterium]
MTGSIRTLATVGAALTLVSATTVAAQGADDTEIRSVVTQQGDAWSRHDAKAYAALFTEDCDVVNVLGWWWHGRLELETKLTAAFSYVFSESQLTG